MDTDIRTKLADSDKGSYYQTWPEEPRPQLLVSAVVPSTSTGTESESDSLDDDDGKLIYQQRIKKN